MFECMCVCTKYKIILIRLSFDCIASATGIIIREMMLAACSVAWLYTKRLLSPWDAYILHKQVIVCGAETRRPRRHSTLKTKIIYPCYSKWRRIAFIRSTIANKTDVVGSDGVVPYNNVYITVITILPAGAIDREFFFFLLLSKIFASNSTDDEKR